MHARDPAADDSNSDYPDTADLVGHAAAGEPDAFRELVRRYHATVYRWAALSLGDRDEAEDVTQLVLIKVHASLTTYRGGAKFTTWLYRITRNVLFETARRQQRRGSLLAAREELHGIAAEVDSPEDTIDWGRLNALLLDYLAALPPRQREVFMLADLEGFVPVEIADLLGVEQVTVRTNLLKARRAIRSRMLREQPKLMEEYRS